MKTAFRLVCPGGSVMQDFTQESPPLSRREGNAQCLVILLHGQYQKGKQARGFYTGFESKRLVTAGKAFSLTVPR